METFSPTTIKSNYRKQCVDPQFYRLIGALIQKDVLDMGCGFGYFTEMLRQLTEGKVYGVDISEDLIKEAQKTNEKGDITYLVKDCATPFSIDHQFDVVFAGGLLANAQNDDMLLGFVRNLYDQLKPGGKLVIFDQSFEMDSIEKVNAFKQRATFEFQRFPPQEYDKIQCFVEGKFVFECYYISQDALIRTFKEVFDESVLTFHEWKYEGDLLYAEQLSPLFESKYVLMITITKKNK